MYVIQKKSDEVAVFTNDHTMTPLRTLKDECGGIAHIVVDDHCYVLVLNTGPDGTFKFATHWFNRAADALRTLPPLA